MLRIGYLGVLLVTMAFILVTPIEVSATGVTDTLEFHTGTLDGGPQIVHVTGDIYAIIFVDDASSDKGRIVTVNISSSGDIADSVIDTDEFQSSSAAEPQIIAVDSDTFALSYAVAGFNGVVRTIDISSTGAIGTAGTQNTFAASTDHQIIQVDSDTFAVVMKEGSAGKIITRDITSGGSVSTPSSNASFTFDSGISGDPQIVKLGDNNFAIVYEDASDEGEIVTVQISDAGAITQSLTDGESQWSSSITAPQITNIASDKYALLWQDGTSPNSPLLKTTTISSVGQITEATDGFPTIIDAFTIDSAAGSTPQMTAVDDNTFAIVYCSAAGNVFFRTLDITSDGQIAAAVTETLDITNGANNFPQILKISSTVFAVVYNDVDNDGKLKTITIPAETTTTQPSSSGGDTTAPTLGKSSTGKQVVENGFSYQSNLGGFTELDADLGLTHMDSLPVAVGGMPEAPPDEIRNDIREKLNEQGLGDVAKTFDNISDALDNLDNFFNRPPPGDVIPDEAPPTPQEISGVLDNLKQGLDQSRVNPESHQNPEQAAQINNLLDRIAQKIAEIEDVI